MERLFHPAETETRPELRPLTDYEIEREAQKLLDDDHACSETLKALQSEIKVRYALSFIEDPDRAARTAHDLLRKITLSAFSTATCTDAMQQTTVMLESPGSATPMLSPQSTYELCYSDAKVTYTGSTARYMDSFCSFLGKNAKETIRGMEAPSHPHHHLRNCTVDTEFDYRKWRTDQGLPYGLDYNSVPTDYWPKSTVEDNSKVSLEVILNFWLSYTRICNRIPGKAEFMERFVKQVDSLTWAATSNKNIFMPMVHIDPMAPEVAAYEFKKIRDIQTLFPERKSMFTPSRFSPTTLVYDHPSLVNGPWPRSRGCPAVSALQTPRKDDQEAVEHFFKYFENRFNTVIPRIQNKDPSANGTYDRATVLLLMGLLFAEHTILDALPTNAE